ncbi:sulfate ABC transporter permease subunit CysT [Tistrella bauzanensis]|uniref:Sulfate transport system permease protein CysT n=2 Tax=Tistrella TaxID=171436 RepID=A0ABU9YF91_9PROT|nr:sulfate ABC transporter permease subunit CysT [Tistrella bauzanensis]GGB53461.1 ABC transporter permease [Tistrella bauzanensis]
MATALRSSRGVLPGFGLTLGITLFYTAIIVALPILALVMKAASLGPAEFWAVVSSRRAVATYQVTLTAAGGATLFNALFGLLLAWVLVRYRFPGRRLLDALVDLPFALPTAVAGIALANLLAPTGWLGAPLADLGLKVAYTPLGIAVAMAFTSIPFVVRTVQPVLEDLSREAEEAAHSLGARDRAIFGRVILPAILPAFLAGAALAFARSLGEFGGVIFIAGNRPFQTEITSLLTYIRLEEYDYPAAAAIATVILAGAFVMLLMINVLQFWASRHNGRG